MPYAGGLTGPSPVDRARTGSKHHLIVDANGIPLAFALTGANRNDVTQLLALVDRVGPVKGRRGRPRQRPDRAVADRGYDHDRYRRELWRRNVKPMIARRGEEHGSGLGRFRWVVERAFAWLHNYRRLGIRWERDPHHPYRPPHPRLLRHLLALPQSLLKPVLSTQGQGLLRKEGKKGLNVKVTGSDITSGALVLKEASRGSKDRAKGNAHSLRGTHQR